MSGRQGGKLKPLKQAKGGEKVDDEFNQALKEKLNAEKKAIADAAKKLGKK
jgi:hypothetical protein